MTFSEVQLQDILDIQWGDTKTTKASYIPRGFLAYSATGPDGFLDKFDYEREGIVLSAIGANCGSTFFATGKWSCIKNTIRIFPKNEYIDLKYFFYMTKAPDFWPIRGSAQPFISQTDIRELYVQIPHISVQRKIGQILFEIEEKISINNQLSKSFEDIAQTIFKSWFVDFDPVKAKKNGEKPIGMDDETAALFPDSFEESELGLIPKGWEVRKISAFGRVVTGKTPSTKKQEFWGSEVPFVTIPDMHGHLMITKTNRALSILGANSQKSQNVPAGSTMVSCIATPGLVAFATKNCQTNQQINSVIPSSQSPSTWLFWHLRSLIPTLIINSGIGTIFANLNKSDFSNIESITAPLELRDAFSRLIGPQVQIITALNKESEQLRSIRDSLLPRLISGELQIPEEMLAS
jgi:type I restriction enzyme S subunit